MAEITITLPDRSQRSVPAGTTVAGLAASIGRGLAKAAVIGVVDGTERDLNWELADGNEVEIVTATYPYVTHVFWYNDRDRTDADPHNDHFGLLTSDLGMKPAYVALASFLGHLVQMPFGASLASAIRGGSAIPFG